MQDIQNCTDLLNDQLVGTPIEDVVDKMKEIEPMMAAKLVRHEVLFEAFVSAFMRFATEKVAVSGRSNMLYQPEFSDINKLKQMMRILENGNLFHQWTDQEGNVAIQIGERNELLQIGDCSVLTTINGCWSKSNAIFQGRSLDGLYVKCHRRRLWDRQR